MGTRLNCAGPVASIVPTTGASPAETRLVGGPPPLDLGTAARAAQSVDRLFSQQLWCWGRDICHQDGNLLLAWGFQRNHPPMGSPAVSLYRFNLNNHSRVVLRGFGIFFGHDEFGGLFLRRYAFAPRLTEHSDLQRPLWLVEDLPRLIVPRSGRERAQTGELLKRALRWFADYEDRVVAEHGPTYREQTIAKWKQQPVVAGEGMAAAWRDVECAVARSPELLLTATPERAPRS